MTITDRKSHPQSHPQSHPSQYTLNPLSSSTTLYSLPQTINFRPKTAFFWFLASFDMRDKRRMHTAYNPDLAAHTTRRTTPAPRPHQSTLRSSRRRRYTTARCTLQLPAARIPAMLVATLTIKAQAETPTVARGYQPHRQVRLRQQRASGSPARIYHPHCVANRLQFWELTFCIPVRYNA